MPDTKIPFFRAPFNYDRDQASLESGLVCDPAEGKTQQQYADEVDINTIVRRFGLDGDLPQTVAVPLSGDFRGVNDFHTAMNLVRKAEEAFAELPARLRTRFSHDPGELIAFLDDPSNRDEAIELGLVNRPPERPRDQAQATAPAPGVPSSSNG